MTRAPSRALLLLLALLAPAEAAAQAVPPSVEANLRELWFARTQAMSQDDVVGALSSVPHDFRDVVVLVDIGDFTYQDAAQILDVPIGTVMSRLHRGRRILKKALADKAVGGS